MISFPHVGLEWPERLGPRPQVNFRRNADYAVDRLYVRAESLGAATVRARYSRLVVDLNRAADDVNADLVPDHPAPRPRPSMSSMAEGTRGKRRPIQNRGVVWRSAVGSIPLLTTLRFTDFAERIDRYHRPYYAAIRTLLERRRAQFGYAILLDAHSMPGTIPQDLVLGTRTGSACAPPLATLAEQALATGSPAADTPNKRAALNIAVDDPYRGGQIVTEFGQPDTNVHALQLEVSRSLYMDEYRLELGAIPSGTAIAQRSTHGTWPPTAQAHDHEARRRMALIAAIDALVLTLSREHAQLAHSLAAE